MKTMKKLASAALALTLALALALAAPAFAAGEETGSITINNAPYNQEYKIYRIFDLESYVTGEPQKEQAHSYTTNTKWAAFVGEGAPGAAYVTLSDNYVTWNENADAVAFAEAALAWAEANNVEADKTATTPILPAEKEPDAMDATAVVSDLPLGYYLVSSSVGALCALDTTNKDAVIKEKNELPTIEKDVKLPETGNKPGVGDSVNYEITVNAKANVKQNYVVHDTMGTGLKFNDDVAIAGLTENVDYTVTTETTDGCTFEVKFTENFKANLTENKTIVIAYSATITADALTVDKLNNTAHLNYGDPNHTINTKDTEVEFDLYEFDVVKTNSAGDKLNGATFTLYDAATEGNQIALVKNPDGTYRPATAEEKAVDGFTSAIIETTDGVATIKGLGEGTYYLQEEEAPNGYNKLKDRQEVILASDMKINGEARTETVDGRENVKVWGGVQVYNFTGMELPETGGIGTTIFYVVGGLLVVGAGVLLVTKRRVSGEEE